MAVNKLVSCSKCKRKFKKSELISHRGFLNCPDCYPYIREPSGRLRKKIPQLFNP